MGGRRVDAARAYADELRAAGLPAFTDPAEAAANLPAVLFLPPELEFNRLGDPLGASVTWRLAVLTRGPAGLEAWEQLDSLLDELAAQVSIESARPSGYTLTGERDPLPAYICTATE